MRRIATLAALPALLLPVAVGAAVIEVQDHGFVVRNESVVAASAERVWNALVRPGRWWDPAHTYSGDARRLSLDPRPGGCFCERLDHRGGVAHGGVVYAAPGQVLRISGALGPLQQDGVSGSLTWSIRSEDGVTTLAQSYSVGGYREGGFAELAPVVDEVLATQLRRLVQYLETGSP